MKLLVKKIANIPLTRQRGFNMVEVMVTLAVLSVGLLGLAALQTIGIRFNQHSYQRTQAVYQAYDIIDRIRANSACIPRAVNLGCDYEVVTLGFIPPAAPNCISPDGSMTCASANIMATYDVAQWNTANGQILNAGRGAACRGTIDANYNCAAGGANSRSYWVAVTWIENDIRMRIDVQADL